MSNPDKMKVQVNMNRDMVKRLDAICTEYGVSRSTWCNMAISQQIVNTEKINASLNADTLSKLINSSLGDKLEK